MCIIAADNSSVSKGSMDPLLTGNGLKWNGMDWLTGMEKKAQPFLVQNHSYRLAVL